MTQTDIQEARLKRMKMRAWRRGTKEMDIVLGPYADENLSRMSAQELDDFEALMAEQDQDLMAWVMGQAPAPAQHAALLAVLTEFAQNRFGEN